MQKMIICAFLLSSMFAINAMDLMEVKRYCCPRVSSVPACDVCYKARQNSTKNTGVKAPQETAQQTVPAPKLTVSQEMKRCP
jgi:hypothetical protein